MQLVPVANIRFCICRGHADDGMTVNGSHFASRIRVSIDLKFTHVVWNEL